MVPQSLQWIEESGPFISGVPETNSEIDLRVLAAIFGEDFVDYSASLPTEWFSFAGHSRRLPTTR